MSEPFRTAIPSWLFYATYPKWLRRRLAAREESWHPYEVTLSRLGRDIEVVTVRARSRSEACQRAERYLSANIYARMVDGKGLCPSWLEPDAESETTR